MASSAPSSQSFLRTRSSFLVLVLSLPLGGGALAVVDFHPPSVSPLAGPGAGDTLVLVDLDLDCALDLIATREQLVASETLSVNVLLGDKLGGYPSGISGEVLIRLVDTNREFTSDVRDRVYVDQLFIRRILD